MEETRRGNPGWRSGGGAPFRTERRRAPFFVRRAQSAGSRGERVWAAASADGRGRADGLGTRSRGLGTRSRGLGTRSRGLGTGSWDGAREASGGAREASGGRSGKLRAALAKLPGRRPRSFKSWNLILFSSEHGFSRRAAGRSGGVARKALKLASWVPEPRGRFASVVRSSGPLCFSSTWTLAGTVLPPGASASGHSCPAARRITAERRCSSLGQCFRERSLRRAITA